MNTISRLINFIISIITLLLLLRFVLKLLGANPASGFANLIYSITGSLLAPFAGIFGSTGIDGGVLEWSTLVAVIVYGIIGAILTWIINSLTPSSREVVVERYETEE